MKCGGDLSECLVEPLHVVTTDGRSKIDRLAASTFVIKLYCEKEPVLADGNRGDKTKPDRPKQMVVE